MKKQADGRYKSKVIVGTRADETKIVKYISAPTKKELEEKRREVLRKYRDGVAEDSSSVLVMEWIYRFFDTSIAPNQKPQTAIDIRAQIKKYIEPYLTDKQLRAVTYFDVQEVMNGTAGMGHTLCSNVQSVLKRSISAAYSQGYIPRDPTAALKTRLPEREHNRAFTDEETAILKRNIAERKIEPLLTALLFYTGIRRGELIGLQWKDVDMRNDVIHVTKDYDYHTRQIDTLKTANAKRDIPIVPALKEILREYQGIGNSFVVHAPTDSGKPLCESSLKRRWIKIRELVGADVTTRTFRNNFATVLYDAGIDVLTASKAMGHADPTTTLKIYTDIDRSRKVQRGGEDIKKMFD